MKIDFLIVTALSEELDALDNQFGFEKHTKKAYNSPVIFNFIKYKKTDGGELNIACYSLNDMGNVNAGITSIPTFDELQPDTVIMFGLAAGLREETNLGDVIVANKIHFYEQGKIKGSDIITRPNSIVCTEHLYHQLIQNFREFKKVEQSRDFHVRFGEIVAGEKVISSKEKLIQLKKDFPKLIGIEMESYGIGLAIQKSNCKPNFVVIRGVCDHADENKDDNFRIKSLTNASRFLDFFFENHSKTLNTNSIKENLLTIHHLTLFNRSFNVADVNQIFNDISHIEIFRIENTNFYNHGVLNNPTSVFDSLLRKETVLNKKLNEFQYSALAYFGLAHIPYSFHLGYHLNREKVKFCYTDRQSGLWKELSFQQIECIPLTQKWINKKKANSSKEAIICFSVSTKINLIDTQETIGSESIPTLELYLASPNIDIIKTYNQVEFYSKQFNDCLNIIRKTMRNIETIHLFFSGPPTLAFSCGQQISQTYDPIIKVYNFSNKDNPRYGWAISLGLDLVEDFRKSRSTNV